MRTLGNIGKERGQSQRWLPCQYLVVGKREEKTEEKLVKEYREQWSEK